MKEKSIPKLFLYRYRFHIGYIFLGICFIALVFALPQISTKGLSEIEMQSVVDSYNLKFSSVHSGNLVNLPYHILQKICILLFGFTTFVIKLPNLILAVILGFLLILLLNRWFKSNVALLASILSVLSVPFLYLASNGTPLIMTIFWPILLLWLGSKINNEETPSPIICLSFVVFALLSIFTPYMIYLDFAIIFYILINPHLRFSLKTLPKNILIAMIIITILGLTVLSINIFNNTEIIKKLILFDNPTINAYLQNIKSAMRLLFSFNNNPEGTVLTPIIGIPTFFLVFVGIFSTIKGFFASRNSIATGLIIFSFFISGFDPESILFLIIPLAILMAHGLKYILEKWYGIFPNNPYARIFGLIPISAFIVIMILSGFTHYIYGYRYIPAVANQYEDTLSPISKFNNKPTLVISENTLKYNFYKVYEDRTHSVNIITSFDQIDESTSQIITIRKQEIPKNFNFELQQIITSPKSDNSDIIYTYTKKEINE